MRRCVVVRQHYCLVSCRLRHATASRSFCGGKISMGGEMKVLPPQLWPNGRVFMWSLFRRSHASDVEAPRPRPWLWIRGVAINAQTSGPWVMQAISRKPSVHQYFGCLAATRALRLAESKARKAVGTGSASDRPHCVGGGCEMERFASVGRAAKQIRERPPI
jgi:hypothetical protein